MYYIYISMPELVSYIYIWSKNFRQNFDPNKSRQQFHHSLKEHHKISKIPKFRYEML